AAIVAARLRKLAERTHRNGFAIAARVAEATRGWLLLLIAIAIALDFLHFGDAAAAGKTPRWTVQHGLHLITYALVGIQVAQWIIALVVAWLHRSTSEETTRPVNPVMLGVLTWAVQFVVWITLVLALLAEGGVTKVGIKSTRIRSLSGEELAVSNSVLLKNLIHNYSRRQERRVVFNFRLPFDTPREKIPEAISRVRGFIEREKTTRFDRGYLSGFGDYGLDFEIVYYVLDPGYNVFVEIQQRINLAMLDAWHELEIEFAIPAQKLHTSNGSLTVSAPVTTKE